MTSDSVKFRSYWLPFASAAYTLGKDAYDVELRIQRQFSYDWGRFAALLYALYPHKTAHNTALAWLCQKLDEGYGIEALEDIISSYDLRAPAGPFACLTSKWWAWRWKHFFLTKADVHLEAVEIYGSPKELCEWR